MGIPWIVYDKMFSLADWSILSFILIGVRAILTSIRVSHVLMVATGRFPSSLIPTIRMFYSKPKSTSKPSVSISTHYTK